MAANTAVHSNAFNFLSFMLAKIDPRTGQFTYSLDLPEIKANDLSGPIVPLSLSFNPLNIGRSFFGTGWELRFSQYDADKQIIALSSGETHKVTSETSGNRLLMAEQKIPSFQFYRDTPNLYRVVHKSGVIEVLELEGNLALPKTLYSPEGFKVSFAYLPFGNGQRRLHTVTDGQGNTLLEINTVAGDIEILLRPDGTPGGALARFLLKLRNSGPGDEVYEVVLPTDDLDTWKFTYQTVNGLHCLTDIKTPTGSHQTIEYAGVGHDYPGNARPPLPRVWKLITHPDYGQPGSEVRFDYNNSNLPGGTNNFLGHNGLRDWDPDGLDNLYRITTRYQYGTTERHFVGGVEVRSIERTFNRFHLLSEEKTTQGNNVQQVFTTYYADDNLDLPFASQPPQAQLAKRVETRWSLKDQSVSPRSQTVHTLFDTHGNLTEQVEANGIKETYSYHPIAGTPGECPADPQGFMRNVREKTVTPAPGREAGAQVLRTRHRYAQMPPVNGTPQDSSDNWLVLTDEHLYEVNGPQEQLLQHSAYRTTNNPANALLHGRREQQAITLNGLTTTTGYAYKKLNSTRVGETVLQTTETLTGHDHDPAGTGTHTQKEVIREESLLHGETLLARDDNDVEIRTTYDRLLRVTSETVAPGTPYVATRHYEYYLSNSADGQASQVTSDVKGVKTKTWFDGENRVIKEQRQDKDHQTGAKADLFRDTYFAEYDALGQLTKETELDWRSAAPTDDLVLVSQYRYDDWGQQRSQVRPDGVEEHEVTDPIKQTVTTWIAGLGKTVTHNNLFDKPDSIKRYNVEVDPANPKWVLYSEHSYFYDGSGRTAHEFDALKNKTAYAYDAFGRMLKSTLPDNAVVERRYALHSTEDLPTWIGVHANGNVKKLGEQAFDGLDRMTQSITGGRVTHYRFKAGETQPCKIIRPTLEEVDYVYEPALGEDPSQRTTKSDSIASTYDYDPQNARLKSSEEGGIKLSREYHTTGEIKSETRVQGGQTFTMSYDYSRQARLLKYVDVLNQDQIYNYDKSTGRLLRTTLGSTEATFGYNSLGEIGSIVTTDGTQTLTTTLTFDDQGREVLRVFDFDGKVTQELKQVYNKVDGLTQSILTENGNLLRDQTYQYDPRSRLEIYECKGTQQPVDPYGKSIDMQTFICDELDNIVRVTTYFPGGNNRATYTFNNPNDPTQLSSVSNNHADYPGTINLTYNADGCLLNDEEGRLLDYDGLGRLISVSVPTGGASKSYGYDPLDTLVSQGTGANAQFRFYQDGEIHNLSEGSSTSTFVRGKEIVLAELQAGAVPKS